MKKTKHIIYYDNRYGRNDGPPLYYLVAMRDKLKFNIDHSLPVGDTKTINGKVDFHWWVDWGEDGLMPRYQEWYPPNDGGKTIYVASDTHLDNGYRYQKALHFDHVFFNQQRAVEEYLPEIAQKLKEVGKEIEPFQIFNAQKPNGKLQTVAWLPHAAEPLAYPKTKQLKKYDVCFIGHLQDVPNYNGFTRIDMLDRAFKEFPNFYFGTRNPQKPEANMFEDAAKKFNQSRVVLNISIKDDINMRLFEVLSSGSFLLTNYLPTISKLFSDGKDLIIYKDLDDMVKKAKYYIAHPKEAEKIANQGHETFMKSHRYEDRITKILELIDKGGEE